MEAAGGLLQFITLIKIAAAIGMVIGLSVLAEKVSPRFAGVLSGFPLGAAISLFFIGYEIGPDFAGRSAVYMVLGLISTQIYGFGYFLGLLLTGRRKGPGPVLVSSFCGLVLYLASAWLLQGITLTVLPAAVASTLAIIFFSYVYRRLDNVRIDEPARLGWEALLLRALFAAAVVLAVTGSAAALGEEWSGVLSAFPLNIFPLMVILHLTYRVEHVLTVIKNVPRGLGCLVVYGLILTVAYPAHGIWLGTVEGYAGATVYLFIINYPAMRGRS